jgi:hypothetical protein
MLAANWGRRSNAATWDHYGGVRGAAGEHGNHRVQSVREKTQGQHLVQNVLALRDALGRRGIGRPSLAKLRTARSCRLAPTARQDHRLQPTISSTWRSLLTAPPWSNRRYPPQCWRFASTIDVRHFVSKVSEITLNGSPSVVTFCRQPRSRVAATQPAWPNMECAPSDRPANHLETCRCRVSGQSPSRGIKATPPPATRDIRYVSQAAS